MEEVYYKENLELEDWSKDSGQMSSSEVVRDLEGKVRQEVVGVDSGDGSRSSFEPLDWLANMESLIGGDNVGDLTMMTKEG